MRVPHTEDVGFITALDMQPEAAEDTVLASGPGVFWVVLGDLQGSTQAGTSVCSLCVCV